MSADRRTPHTDALDTLGKIHQYLEHRDAIHLGVEPVTAGEDLQPASHIYVKDGIAFAGEMSRTVGIVDPFLTNKVKIGERFWCVVYPRTIKSLRHVWEHPDFPLSVNGAAISVEDTQKRQRTAEKWLLEFCSERSLVFEGLLEAGQSLANEITSSGEQDKFSWYLQEDRDDYSNGFLIFRDLFVDLDYDEVPDELWTHLETLIGKSIPAKFKNVSFSCSC